MFDKLVLAFVAVALYVVSGFASAAIPDAEKAGFKIMPDMRAAMSAPGKESPKAWLGNAIQFHYENDPLSIEVGQKYRLPEARSKCATGDRDACATASGIEKWLGWAKTAARAHSTECDRAPCDHVADNAIPEGLKGKSWVLHAWASWCPYCRLDHDRLTALKPREKSRLVSLVYQDTEGPAADFLSGHGDPYAGGRVATNRALLNDLDLRNVPMTFLIGPDGNVVKRFRGTMGDAGQSAVVKFLDD